MSAGDVLFLLTHMVSLLIRTHVGEAADEPAWRERTNPRDDCSNLINRGVRLSMTNYFGEHIYSKGKEKRRE